ncbi:hypothetical protein [Paenibacillus koleovorans]|uniref:hypothetical protein n=1 Tax=Paenibacillus koleovorans TaxID=121608 RepID=UPI000FDC54BA|nr:hypothetical protein [Paenibacillus koleovorans]
METEKRRLIVREIEHWRRSRLLPEQYCDFLLNLYADDSVERERRIGGVSVKTIQNSRWYIWFLIFGSISVISLLALHFNSFPLPLQMGLLACAVLGCYAYGLKVKHKNPILTFALIGIGSAALLAGGVMLLRMYGKEEAVYLVGYVAFCSLMWIAIGAGAGLRLFQFCGWLGLALVYAWLLYPKELSHTKLGTELSWLPLCVLFGWFGFLLQRRGRPSGIVLLLLAFVFWIAPELYGFYVLKSIDSWYQALLFLKLVGLGLVLFGTRKKWIEWVA